MYFLREHSFVDDIQSTCCSVLFVFLTTAVLFDADKHVQLN